MIDQRELSFEDTQPDDPVVLRRLLTSNDWMTRAQLGFALGWSARRVRAAAEELGPDVVRGQHGFKLTEKIQRAELPDLVQASDAALSQGKRMIRYGLALRRRGHEVMA